MILNASIFLTIKETMSSPEIAPACEMEKTYIWRGLKKNTPVRILGLPLDRIMTNRAIHRFSYFTPLKAVCMVRIIAEL